MCGIVGLFGGPDGDPATLERLASTMLAPLRNRGPDGQHVWSQPGIALGHARLSILDLQTRSDQPMRDPETGCVITFNGEIYNYLELRAELEALGHRFHTGGDTEVILKAYAQWGPACQNRFNGMWAFGIYDPRTERLFCSRDRFGVKPFLYAFHHGQLLLASEAKALVAACPELQTPNQPFLQHFLTTGDFGGSEATFYQEIRQLLPGHCFEVSSGEAPRPRRYWDWQPGQTCFTGSFADAVETFRHLLTDAIRLRFRSDVPVGVCLSGGLDSSAIVALASQAFTQPIHTFSCIYPQYPALDESPYIRQTVARFGCVAQMDTPRFEEDFFTTLQQSVWEQDGPTGTPAVLSQRAVMAMAHGRVTVLLDGQGADEVLGGYHAYFPHSLRGLMRGLLAQPSWSGWQAYRQAQRAIQLRTGRRTDKLSTVFKAARRPLRFPDGRFGASVLDAFAPLPGDDLSTQLLTDTFYQSLPRLLHYEDRNSMAFSLESRLPFLDYRLVEFLFSLPAGFKIQQARTKALLFDTVKVLLPPEVLHRRDKMGYETPGGQWFQDASVRHHLEPYLHQPPEALAGIVPHLSELHQAWQACGHGDGGLSLGQQQRLWRYFTTCLWLEGSGVKPPASGRVSGGSGLAPGSGGR